MANSDLSQMAQRLERLEGDVGAIKGALVHMTGILVDHGQRLDTVTQRLDTLTQRVDGIDRRLESFQDAVTQRLDRLIDVTMRARTMDAERFADVERRLSRLEERVGV